MHLQNHFLEHSDQTHQTMTGDKVMSALLFEMFSLFNKVGID